MSVINIANIILLRIFFTIIILMNILLTEVNSQEKVGVPQTLVLRSSNKTITGASTIPLLIQCSRQSGNSFNTQISTKGTALNVLVILKICLITNKESIEVQDKSVEEISTHSSTQKHNLPILTALLSQDNGGKDINLF